MSIVGILASNFFSARASHHSADAAQTGQSNPSRFQQIRTEFQQLGQDLQSGNLTQAQSDYASLSQDFPGAVATTAATSTATAVEAATSASASAPGNNPVAQAFQQLGRDLKSGNLQAAQQDYANLQQDVQLAGQLNAGQQVGEHHHRHHHPVGGGTQAASSPSSPRQSSVNQAFGTLAQDLQAGNLSGAQSAFATLQNDLQQLGGFLPPTRSTGIASATAPGSVGNLNVTA